MYEVIARPVYHRQFSITRSHEVRSGWGSLAMIWNGGRPPGHISPTAIRGPAGRGSMLLSHLAGKIPDLRLSGQADPDVRRIAYDSRLVEPGDLFVAIRGAQHDGGRFARDAIARGAVAVIADQQLDLPAGVGAGLVPDARRVLGELASALYGRPSEALRLTGVTGTDGKTTTCQLVAHVLAASGRRVGWMTTVDVRIGDHLEP